MKATNLTLRILALPFILGMVIIKYNYYVIVQCALFIKYGGEWITYAKGDRNTILDIYKELKDNRKV